MFRFEHQYLLKEKFPCQFRCQTLKIVFDLDDMQTSQIPTTPSEQEVSKQKAAKQEVPKHDVFKQQVPKREGPMQVRITAKKCPNMEFFLVRILPHSDGVSPRIQSECRKIRTRKNSLFGLTQWNRHLRVLVTF